MARQYDAMVKPRRFNIGDLVLKRVTLAKKNPAYGKLGPNWKDLTRLSIARGKDPIIWKLWMDGG